MLEKGTVLVAIAHINHSGSVWKQQRFVSLDPIPGKDNEYRIAHHEYCVPAEFPSNGFYQYDGFEVEYIGSSSNSLIGKIKSYFGDEFSQVIVRPERVVFDKENKTFFLLYKGVDL